MTKRNILLYTVFFIVITASFSLLIPETLRQMEGSDFFTYSSDFWIQKISNAPGVTGWLSNFLLQFFKWPLVGMMIMSFVLTLTAIFCGMLPQAMGRKGFPELSLLLPLFLSTFVLLNMNVYLQAAFFFCALLLGIHIKRPLHKSIFLLLFSIVGFFLICWPLLALTIIFIAGEAYFRNRKPTILIVGIVSLAITIADVYISNALFGFLPFDHRFFYSPIPDINTLEFITIFIISILLVMIPIKELKKWKSWIPFAIMIIATCVITSIQLHREDVIHTEKTYLYAKLSDEKQWTKLLSTIPHEETLESKLPMCYALLAESALGTLPDHIFDYNIFDPEQFLFRHELKSVSCLFNRQFYDNLGVYDEAFRQAFEYGVMSPDGTCFSSLRQMTHYAILMGNYEVANKYLDILDNSTLNGSWVKNERQLMNKHKKPNQKLPIVKDTFVSVYQFNSEMIRQLQVMPKNRKALDYLLLGLLMQRQLDKFSIIIHAFPLYKNQPLPKAYAEAGAMLAQAPKLSLHNAFSYSSELDKQFLQFYQMQQQNKDPNAFVNYYGTYWYFYFFIQPAQQAQEEQGRAVNS